jgi:hypothetical protein
VGAIRAAAGVDELWRRGKEKERRASASASSLGVQGKRCAFFLFTLPRFTLAVNRSNERDPNVSRHSGTGTKCQATHRPHQMDESDHLR